MFVSVLYVDLVLGDERLITKLDGLLRKRRHTVSREGEPKSWKMEDSQAVIWKYLNYPVIFRMLALRSSLNDRYWSYLRACFLLFGGGRDS